MYEQTKLRGLSPRANNTAQRPLLVGEVSVNILQIEGVTWSAWQIPMAVSLVL
jgi:hypothetical protein